MTVVDASGSGKGSEGEGRRESSAPALGARAFRHSFRPLLSVGAFLSFVNVPAVLATVLWAGNKTALKIALADMDPILVGVLRMAIAGCVLLAVVAVSERSPWLPWRDWPRMLVVGGLGIGVNAILLLEGLARTSVSNSALILTTSPIFSMAMAVAIGQERLVRRRLAGVLLSLLGVALLIRSDAARGVGEDFVGDLFLLGSAMTWAAYSVLGAKLYRAHGSAKPTAYSLLAGAVTIGLATPLLVRSWDLGHVGPVAWAGLLYAAIMASVVGLTLWNHGVRRVGATQTMVYTYLAPLLAIASAAALLGERLSLAQVVGGVIVLAGLTLSASARGS